MCVTATAVSGVYEDGFQMIVSPQMAARAEFHDQTATGKLKAVIRPRMPSGCHCSYMRWAGAFRVHAQAVQHARLPDGEVADVDHLLHFAVALGADLAHLERDQVAQRFLRFAQGVAEIANHLPRVWEPAPVRQVRKAFCAAAATFS